MKFVQKLSFLEHLKGYIAIQIRPPWLWLYLLLPIAGVLPGIISGASPTRMLAPFIIGIIIAAIWVFLGSLLGTFMGRLNNIYHTPMSFTFDNDGMGMQTSTVTIQYKWAQIQRVLETKDFFVFYLSSFGGMCLFKKVIPLEQIEAFRQLLRTHTGDKAKQ